MFAVVPVFLVRTATWNLRRALLVEKFLTPEQVDSIRASEATMHNFGRNKFLKNGVVKVKQFRLRMTAWKRVDIYQA